MKKHSRNQNVLQFALYMAIVAATLAAALGLVFKGYGWASWHFAAAIVGVLLTARLAWVGGRFSVHWD